MKAAINYRTFSQLMDEVVQDLKMYKLEGMIDDASLIKVAQKCNYKLGIRINTDKSKILTLEHGVVKLPDDFYKMNCVYALSEKRVECAVPQGVHTEDGEHCDRCSVEEEGNECVLVHKVNTETRIYKKFVRIKMVGSQYVDPLCVEHDKFYTSEYTGEIKGDHLYVHGIKHATLYISYAGRMEDEEGNLLVLDNDLVNEYYEYSIKERILENLYLNGEDVIQRLQLIQSKLKMSWLEARNIVNTPDFKEMYDLWRLNRKTMYRKYYQPFI